MGGVLAYRPFKATGAMNLSSVCWPFHRRLLAALISEGEANHSNHDRARRARRPRPPSRASARQRELLKVAEALFWRHFLDRSAWCSYFVLPLDERRLNAPDGRRPHPPRNRRNKREVFKDRHCETLAGMKGWRLSAGQGLEPDRALFKRTYSCRTSDRSPVFSTGPGALPRGPRVPLFAARLRGRRVGANGVHVKAIEMAPALRLLKETPEEKTKTEGTQSTPTRSASTALRQGRKPRKTPSGSV